MPWPLMEMLEVCGYRRFITIACRGVGLRGFSADKEAWSGHSLRFNKKVNGCLYRCGLA